MATLDIDHVSKTFGNTKVLDDVNIHLAEGEFLILVGPSGCGKSTLLNMIAGLETISEGTITLDDNPVNNLSPRERDIAMVFQFYALYPNMTVRKNIDFGLKMRGMEKTTRQQVVEQVAKTLQIENLLDRKPAQLSGGQRQRVAIGRALARKPSLYLFDEPLSNLDAKLRVEMRAEIKQLHQQVKTTMVYVTHDQIEAMTLGDRIAVMGSGRVQQLGTPHDIYNNPANQYVAGFIGSPSMNFITCDCRVIDTTRVQLNPGHAALTLTVPEATAQKLNDSGKTQFTLGIRPEHLKQAQTDDAWPCRIDMVEPTGPDTYLHTYLAKTKVIVRADPLVAAQTGQEMALTMDTDHLFFFDQETGARIA